jgi:hypothetical protein
VKAIVVYESLWANTARIAGAIAECERARAWSAELAAALPYGAAQRRATSSWPRTPAGRQRCTLYPVAAASPVSSRPV